MSRVHILRHSVASRLLREGAPLKEIADVLRHRSLNTTAIYAKVDTVRQAGADDGKRGVPSTLM